MKKIAMLAGICGLCTIFISGCMSTYPYAQDSFPDELDIRGARIVVLAVSGDEEQVTISLIVEQTLEASGDFDVIDIDEIREEFPAYPGTLVQGISSWKKDWALSDDELDTILSIARTLDAEYAIVLDSYIRLYSQVKGGNIRQIIVDSNGNIIDVMGGNSIGYINSQSGKDLMLSPSNTEKINQIVIERAERIGEAIRRILLNETKDYDNTWEDDS